MVRCQPHPMQHTATQGFTFVELLLVITILGLIVGLAVPFYQSFQVTSQLDNSTQEIVQALRRAQSQAMASEAYIAHGVHFEQSRYILFRGTTFSPADPFNETVDLPPTVIISAMSTADVQFSRVQGVAGQAASLTVSTTNGESNGITISVAGVVNVE